MLGMLDGETVLDGGKEGLTVGALSGLEVG